VLVLVSNREDLTADWLVLELERRDEPFVRLCTEDYPSKIRIGWTLNDAALELGESTLAAEDVTAVWWRRSVAPVIPAGRSPGEMAWAAGESLAAWDGFWEGVNAHWVNTPGANAKAESKPAQLRAAKRLGMNVPATLITSSRAAARSFVEAEGTVVCKALRSGLIPGVNGDRVLYTQPVDPQMLAGLEELGPEPYLFQALVEKSADVRVTVIGERVFACRIDSQSTPDASVDWRRGSAEDLHHESIELDEPTTRRLRDLTAGFGLRFAAIDLAVDRERGYVFFEINPNGQWAWVEQLTGQPLASALADELLRR
jgi:hypothetical protein